MKYTLLLASVAALQPVALALPQGIAEPPARANNVSASAVPNTRARVDAEFGESPAGAEPGKINVEQTQNDKESGIRVNAQSSGPFRIRVELSNEDAAKKVRDGAQAAGASERDADAIAQKVALPEGATAPPVNGSAVPVNGATLNNEAAVVQGLAQVAEAAAKTSSNGTQVAVVRNAVEPVAKTVFEDSDRMEIRILIDIIVASAISGENARNVQDVAQGFVESVKKAEDQGGKQQQPVAAPEAPASDAPVPAEAQAGGPVTTSSGSAPSSAPTSAPGGVNQGTQGTQGNNQTGAGAGVDPTRPVDSAEPPRDQSQPGNIDEVALGRAAEAGCKNEICRILVSITMRMTSQRISVGISMSILAGVDNLAKQSPALSQGVAPAAGSKPEQSVSEDAVKQLANQAVDQAAKEAAKEVPNPAADQATEQAKGPEQAKSTEDNPQAKKGADIIANVVVTPNLPETAVRNVEKAAEDTAAKQAAIEPTRPAATPEGQDGGAAPATEGQAGGKAEPPRKGSSAAGTPEGQAGAVPPSPPIAEGEKGVAAPPPPGPEGEAPKDAKAAGPQIPDAEGC